MRPGDRAAGEGPGPPAAQASAGTSSLVQDELRGPGADKGSPVSGSPIQLTAGAALGPVAPFWFPPFPVEFRGRRPGTQPVGARGPSGSGFHTHSTRLACPGPLVGAEAGGAEAPGLPLNCSFPEPPPGPGSCRTLGTRTPAGSEAGEPRGACSSKTHRDGNADSRGNGAFKPSFTVMNNFITEQISHSASICPPLCGCAAALIVRGGPVPWRFSRMDLGPRGCWMGLPRGRGAPVGLPAGYPGWAGYALSWGLGVGQAPLLIVEAWSPFQPCP